MKMWDVIFFVKEKAAATLFQCMYAQTENKVFQKVLFKNVFFFGAQNVLDPLLSLYMYLFKFIPKVLLNLRRMKNY